ncbi:hypothetical protein V8F33_008455 [Rhypophila sp. PSN 637]
MNIGGYHIQEQGRETTTLDHQTVQSIRSTFQIPSKVLIDVAIIDEDLGPTPSDIHRNSWAAGKLQDYSEWNLIDEDLFARYCQDFNDWSNADFNSLPNSTAVALRNLLYSRGIYTGKKQGSAVTDQLYEVLTTEDDPEWPEEALRRAQLDPGSVAFKMQQLLQQKMPFSEVQVMYGYGLSPTTTTSAPMITSATPSSMSMAPMPVPAMPLDKGKSVQFGPAARHPATVITSTNPSTGFSTDFAAPVRPTIESNIGPNTPQTWDTAHTQFPTSYQFYQPSNIRGSSRTTEDPAHTTLTDPQGNRIASVAPPEAIKWREKLSLSTEPQNREQHHLPALR